ncbi:hypothetical protein [Actinoplanes sp. NPDC049316]|uniref:hypothetical protein n=1 Tax=Actinoplanes sp. NPDC049316 TaxID=3154727 RepID=UPI00341A0664
MSDTPRDQGRNPDSEGAGPDDAIEPTTGPPAGANPAGGAPLGTGATGASTASATPPGAGTASATPPGAGTSSATLPGAGAAGVTPAGAGATSATPASAGTASATPASAGTASATPAGATPPGTGATSATSAGATSAGATSAGANPAAASGYRAGRAAPGRTRAARLSPAGPETDARKRRRRRWLVAGISVGAALLAVACCAGGLAVVSRVADLKDDAADARADRSLRDAACLEFEQRLNRLVPPGATPSPQARAAAVRDENAAARIYVTRVRDGSAADGWRQLVDARTAYAEALDAQAKSRTPAFFVAPRTGDGRAVADELVRSSPPACAGPIRRLAAPDL